jgi:hypothetical protein
VSVYGYFEHARFLTTGTVIYEPPDMLTLKLPSLVGVFESLESALKTKMTNFRIVKFTNCVVLLTREFKFLNNICSHDYFR